jgi:hypothetical protein
VDVIRVHNRILVVAAQRGEGLDVPASEPEPVVHEGA